MVHDIVKIHVLSPLQFQYFIPISIFYLLWENLIHDNGNASVMKWAGMILWVPNLSSQTLKQNLANEFFTLWRSSSCQHLWHPVLEMNVLDFPFISVWHLSNISAPFHFFFFFREWLCTQHVYVFLLPFSSVEKSLAQLIPKLPLNWNLETQIIPSVWPENLTSWIGSFHTNFSPR